MGQPNPWTTLMCEHKDISWRGRARNRRRARVSRQVELRSVDDLGQVVARELCIHVVYNQRLPCIVPYVQLRVEKRERSPHEQ